MGSLEFDVSKDWALRFTFHHWGGKGTLCFSCVRMLSLSKQGGQEICRPLGAPWRAGVVLRGLFCLMLRGLGPPLECGCSAVFKSTSYK